MKALISACALIAFVAGTTLPIQTYAQSTGTGQTMAPDTSTSTAPSTSTKKKKSSKSHHAKKKSKKSSTAQSSSAKQKHVRHSVS
jgi:stringent starvation protein B